MNLQPLEIESRVLGCLVGGAIGDALGLPFEGNQPPILYAPPENWRLSDDTQLTLATCTAIVEKEEVCPEAVAKSLHQWFREGRVHGIGASTLKALRELDAGGHWALVGRRGEMAAGNGAAMRIAPLGFLLDPNNDDDRVVLRDVCRITHHSDEAYVGALAVAAAIHLIAHGQSRTNVELVRILREILPDSNVRDRLAEFDKLESESELQRLAQKFGNSGYVAESVPLAIAALVLQPFLGFEGMLRAIIECGGDTDTTASIAGQIAGTSLGIEGLPEDLVAQVPDTKEIRELASQLSAPAG